MRRIRSFAALAALFVAGCAQMPAGSSTSRVLGTPSPLGSGSVAAYADLDGAGNVQALGVLFTRGALDGLPQAPSDGNHCFDENRDGVIDLARECFASHERVLPMPSEVGRRPDVPFKWALLNWNPHGHIPPGIYDKPHFDVHFYIDTIENVFAIAPGPCGTEKVRCDQFDRARRPVPANYLPADFKDVEAVAPAMGNHYVDLTAPEFRGTPFSRTWIYGAYDGRVTFYEEMVTLDHLRATADACYPIKVAPAVAQAGRYPTRSCLRQVGGEPAYTVSMEGFEMRAASAPAR